MKIGFIGQGWIGKHYADDFEHRGYEVVRYSLDKEHQMNKEKVSACEIVFIAVPTPTTPEGHNVDAVRAVLPLVGKDRTVVIKSTMSPGTTELLQADFPHVYIFHSPEFLTEKTAAYDAAHPNRNIVGTPMDTNEYQHRAQQILAILPESPYSSIMSSRDAEFVKYAGNCFLFTKVIFMNLLYDIVLKEGGDWQKIKEALGHDPRIGMSHTEPIHQSGHITSGAASVKRGAGGHCFIKDFEVFRRMYAKVDDKFGDAVLSALMRKNIQLLLDSKKDLELLEGVYGDLNNYQS